MVFYVSKDLETFKMAVQFLVLIHPRELEVPKLQDFAITPEKVTADDFAFAKEKPAGEDVAIAQEKPAAEDFDTAKEKDAPEKAEMAAAVQDLEMADAEDSRKVNPDTGA